MIQSGIVDDYLNYLKAARGRSESTTREYYYDIRQFLRYMRIRKEHLKVESLDEVSIDEVDKSLLESIDKSDIYAYISYLDSGRGNSGRTKFRKISSVRSFFDYLTYKVELLDKNPAENIDMPKIERSLPVYLTLEEAVRLLNTVENSKQKDIYRLRDYAITTLFLNCGLRLSELSSLNVEDLNKDNTLRIMGKGSKERLVYLNGSVQEALRAYLRKRNELEMDQDALFLSMRKNRMSNRSIQHMLEKHLKAAGFDTRKYTVHKLRHTAATLMYQYGNEDLKSLQEILGHESVSTTQIYTHVNLEDIRYTMNQNPLSNMEDVKKIIDDDTQE
ncbi:phage integrase, SAM-like domain protein [Aedoeadaptatus nemausensis]|uniref:Phage integrase, SAM-like domain protein n=1 Tax=Aedoeadaptatus nemausensis TaxID=2582829 RepID=A0A6V6Y051_9FIRM|nr:tyrosine recombinase XerC [Peptoniphilus nemausensis]CAC9924816.1 phage integrase, SAM-like domain protein [Peptoniphilus nemausensis]